MSCGQWTTDSQPGFTTARDVFGEEYKIEVSQSVIAGLN
jgi:hypothetical protein